jgi:Phage integrase family
MQSQPLLDRAGRRRSLATTADFHRGVPPRNKGMRYPPDPPTVEEIIAVMRAAGEAPDGVRLRAMIVMLWRAGLRISEALALNETDLDDDRGAVLVRHGKGDKRREVGMDRWAWSHLEPWLAVRQELPVGRLFCVMRGPTRGRPLRAGGRPRSTAPHGRGCRGAPPVRAAPAAPRARGRDVTRGDLADRDPAATRARRPRYHLTVSPRDRQHRDHPSRPPATRADDPRRQTTQPAALNPPRCTPNSRVRSLRPPASPTPIKCRPCVAEGIAPVAINLADPARAGRRASAEERARSRSPIGSSAPWIPGCRKESFRRGHLGAVA